jgi:hypothetical protein
MFHRSWFRPVLGLLLAGLLAAPALTRAGEKASPDVKQLQQQLKALQDEVKALRDRVQALEKKSPSFPGRTGFPVPGGGFPFPGGKQPVKATVKSFDKDKATVILMVAADSGIKAGQHMMAMKLTGGRPQMLGMLEVKDVSGKEVTASVAKKGPFPLPGGGGGTFEADQEVSLMIFPASFPGGPGGRPPAFPPFKKDKEKDKE